MSYSEQTGRRRLLIAFLFCSLCSRLFGSDGFDNNYVGSDANQLLVTIDNVPHAVVFGPGLLSSGGYYLDVPNGATLDLGAVQSFRLNQVISFLRSAYLDRVQSTTLYYRLYPAAAAPPAWSTLDLQPIAFLDPDSCYTTTQTTTWETAPFLNLVYGLPQGAYVIEFYLESLLHDVGAEAPDPCIINASYQCDPSVVHPGRFISSRFGLTDPSSCNFDAVTADMFAPSRMTFELTGTSGLDDAEAWARPRIFPNPVAGDAVSIDWSAVPDSRRRWQLVAAGGRILRTGEGDSVPVGDLPKGLYWLALGDKNARQAVVVQ
jgi:hypothetical protein